MKLVVFGATGMIGQGLLRGCLIHAEVERVLIVGRTASGIENSKVKELVHSDLFDYRAVESELTGYDAAIFCLGVSAAGMKEADYKRITYDLTLAAAQTLLRLNPQMTFIYISGEGTDGTGAGRTMWARIKGQTENALLALGFRRAYMFRPGFVQPIGGLKSKTRIYRMGYAVMSPLFPLLNWIAPSHMTTSVKLSDALLKVANDGYEKPVLENNDINAVASAWAANN